MDPTQKKTPQIFYQNGLIEPFQQVAEEKHKDRHDREFRAWFTPDVKLQLMTTQLVNQIKELDDPTLDDKAEDKDADRVALNKQYAESLGFQNEQEFKAWRAEQRANHWEGADKTVKVSAEHAASTESFLKNPPKSLLDLVSRHEAKDYNTVWGNRAVKVDGQPAELTGMTLNQVMEWQTKQHAAGVPSTAAGKYQFMLDTLKGLKADPNNHLTGNEVFTKEFQDQLAVVLMQRRGLDKFLAGNIDAKKFASNLSAEWASMPDPNKNGLSHYADSKDKNARELNRASGTVDSVLNALNSFKQAALASTPVGRLFGSSSTSAGTTFSNTSTADFRAAALSLPKPPGAQPAAVPAALLQNGQSPSSRPVVG